MKKKVLISLGIAFLISMCAIGMFALQPAEISCIQVGSERYSDVFEEDGEITVNEEMPVYVEQQEKVTEVKVKEGQAVSRGDVLFTIDDTKLKFEMENLKGQRITLLGQKTAEGEKTNAHQIEAQLETVELAKSNLEDLSQKYNDSVALYEEGGISQYELDAAKKRKEDEAKNLKIQTETLKALKASNDMMLGAQMQYEGSLQQIDAQIDLLNYQIEKCTVKSPIDGIVSELNIKKGEIPALDTAALKVFQSDHYKAEVLVLSEDVVGLKENMEAAVIRKIKGQEVRLSGFIENIAPSAVETVSTLGLIEQRVKVIVSINESRSDILRPGDNVDVEFTAYSKENSLVIPKEAVFPVAEGDAVWGIEDGKAVLKTIETGYETDQYIVVAKGLTEGEHVVYPLDDVEIDEGMRVRIAE